MTTLVLEADPVAVDVRINDDKLIIDLADGRSLSIPLEWYPRLVHATADERRNWQLLGEGYAIEWPDIDEHIGVEGLIASRRSGESNTSIQRWLIQRWLANTLIRSCLHGPMCVRLFPIDNSP